MSTPRYRVRPAPPRLPPACTWPLERSTAGCVLLPVTTTCYPAVPPTDLPQAPAIVAACMANPTPQLPVVRSGPPLSVSETTHALRDNADIIGSLPRPDMRPMGALPVWSSEKPSGGSKKPSCGMNPDARFARQAAFTPRFGFPENLSQAFRQ